MSQQQGNDLAAPEPLANTDAANPPKAIEDKLNKLWEIALHRYEPAIRKQAIQAIITTETTNARIDELQHMSTHRHYGMDYQDSMDELATYKEDRLAALQKQQGDK